MKAYLAHIRSTMKLTMRDRIVLFFNYLLPLLFFVVFAQSFGADKGGAISQVITMVLIMGVLGSGFFGAGLRAVQERELNILRRFKVAPITPMPLLVSSLVTGVIAYLPSLAMILLVSHFWYGMPWPERWLSLTLLLTLGLVSFRSIGLTIAAVVNSMQESQIIIQLMYLPMLFLSGATFPVGMLPDWLQLIAQFMPATYLYTGLNGILVRKESLAENWLAVAGMLITTTVAIFLAVRLFRWEKDEKLPARAKLSIAAVMLPFLLLGAWQMYRQDNIVKAKALFREMRRNRALLIRGPRVITGDGKVIAAGGVLIRDGRIAEVYESVPPENAAKAEVMEAAGKTLLPGLIDAHVHLAMQGGVLESYKDFNPTLMMERELAAYIYSGVVAVRSVGDPAPLLRVVDARIASGELLGAELLQSGKIFTVPGGYGTEYFRQAPESMRRMAEQETLFFPTTPDQARQQVDQLKQTGAACVKVAIDARLPEAVLRAIVDQARKHALPVAAHTATAAEVARAVAAGVSSIEHGSSNEAIPDETFAQMAKLGIAYDATLAAVEAREGDAALLDRSLVQQVAPEGLIEATRRLLGTSKPAPTAAPGNLLRAWKSGVPLIAGTDSGQLLLVHGPAIHRELQLWVKAGVPAAAALQAATTGNAKALGLANRLGQIRRGYDASFFVVDGNPLEDIAATERISAVFFRGERVDRSSLFDLE